MSHIVSTLLQQLNGVYVGKHREVTAGNTGDEEKEYEFIPLPEEQPIKEPVPATPAPAPEPEKVPAGR